MADEPSAKRMKSIDEFPNLRAEVAGPVKEKLMQLDAVQHQLDIMSEKAAEEILKVETVFNKKRVPIYAKRKKLTTQIDNFWQTAFLNHHLLSTAIPEDQEDLVGALRDLEVQEFEDIRSGFKIIMTFDKNPYFDNETITKSYHLQSETPSTMISDIEWKAGKKPDDYNPESDNSITFLEWLRYAAPPDSDEIAEVIKDDLFTNPLQYYVMPDVNDIEDDDIEDFMEDEKDTEEMEDGDIDETEKLRSLPGIDEATLRKLLVLPPTSDSEDIGPDVGTSAVTKETKVVETKTEKIEDEEQEGEDEEEMEGEDEEEMEGEDEEEEEEEEEEQPQQQQQQKPPPPKQKQPPQQQGVVAVEEVKQETVQPKEE